MRAGVARISTTFPRLDEALGDSRAGKGGVPRGRITEIIGAATSGKVTLAAKVLSAAHSERAALVAWLDLNRTCDPDYLHRCGIDLDRLLVVRPEDGLDALTIALHLVESNTLTALVFDGLSDLPPGHDAASSGILERLATVVTRTEAALLFLSELQPENRVLAYAATVRLKLSRQRWLARAGDVRGYEARVEIVKNRLGRAGAAVPIRIVFNGTVRGDGL
jgi:recombination protein RecA